MGHLFGHHHKDKRKSASYPAQGAKKEDSFELIEGIRKRLAEAEQARAKAEKGDADAETVVFHNQAVFVEELDKNLQQKASLIRQNNALVGMYNEYTRQQDQNQVSLVKGQLAEIDSDLTDLAKVAEALVSAVKALGGNGLVERVKVKFAFAGDPGDGSQLPLVVGEMILVLLADNDEWWMGKNSKGDMGFFPCKFVVKEPPFEMPERHKADGNDNTTAPSGTGAVAVAPSGTGATAAAPSGPGANAAGNLPAGAKNGMAQYAFSAGSATELDLQKGQAVVVTNTDDADWWEGYIPANPGKRGFFPATYVKIVENSQPAAASPAPNKRTINNPKALRESLRNLQVDMEAHKICKVIADYQARSEGELSISAGQVLIVTNMDDPDWWEGTLRDHPDGGAGFFPKTFVEVVSAVVARKASLVVAGDAKKKVAAKHAYTARSATELSLAPGDVLIVVDDSDPEWWSGQNPVTEATGFFPSSYVEAMPDGAAADKSVNEDIVPKVAAPQPPSAAQVGSSAPARDIPEPDMAARQQHDSQMQAKVAALASAQQASSLSAEKVMAQVSSMEAAVGAATQGDNGGEALRVAISQALEDATSTILQRVADHTAAAPSIEKLSTEVAALKSAIESQAREHDLVVKELQASLDSERAERKRLQDEMEAMLAKLRQ